MIDNIDKIISDNSDLKPNRYCIMALTPVFAVLLICFILNELSIFELNLIPMRMCMAIITGLYIVLAFIIKDEKILAFRETKYIILVIIFLITLILNVLLNANAVLSLLLPIMLATQYNSKKYSCCAFFGAVVIAVISPVISYLIHTWDASYLIGYAETVLKIRINVEPDLNASDYINLGKIVLYLSLPRALIVSAFGFILMSITNNSIISLNNQVKVHILKDDLDRELAQKLEMKQKVLTSIADVIESRDLLTGGHVKRTSKILEIITDRMIKDNDSNMSEHYADMIVHCAPLHDIGKIMIPDAVLNKPGKLTESEYEIMKQHTTKAYDIVSKVLEDIEDEDEFEVTVNICRYHHEHFDGTGYPEHLSSENIPLEARLMTLVDVYDSLVTKRVYKKEYSFDDAYKYINSQMGKHFDPKLMKYFDECREEIEAYYKKSYK